MIDPYERHIMLNPELDQLARNLMVSNAQMLRFVADTLEDETIPVESLLPIAIEGGSRAITSLMDLIESVRKVKDLY